MNMKELIVQLEATAAYLKTIRLPAAEAQACAQIASCAQNIEQLAKKAKEESADAGDHKQRENV